jgi:hypothetical protein
VSCGGVLVRACVSRIDRDDVVGLVNMTTISQTITIQYASNVVGIAQPGDCGPNSPCVMFRSLAGND